MIGNIAHQWRQPLSVITAASSGLQIKKDFNDLDDKTFKQSTDGINENAQYLSATINTFSDFINEKKELKELILQERIKIIKTVLGASLENKNIQLKDNIDTTPIYITMTTGELDQAIINILNNAKDILLERNIDEPWIELNLEQNNNNIIITIEDNGGGIPEDIMSKIFELYFTTKHQSQGTGLGLSMSYNVITNSLKGKLWVENTKNGAKFFIEIPLDKRLMQRRKEMLEIDIENRKEIRRDEDK